MVVGHLEGGSPAAITTVGLFAVFTGSLDRLAIIFQLLQHPAVFDDRFQWLAANVAQWQIDPNAGSTSPLVATRQENWCRRQRLPTSGGSGSPWILLFP
jgi:hypothetical protein